MARQARFTLPGQPHHLLIRGNNRQPICVDDDDRRRLQTLLAELLREQQIALHAYVLMPNHLHLLATPKEGEALGRAVQSFGRRYVGAFNARHGRSGTLWEGRYRANVVGPDEVLSCMRFIESNPQRSGVASGLLDWPWSSLPHHLGATRDPLVTEPVAYWQLGNTPFDRDAAYRTWLEQGVGSSEAQRIVKALVSGRPLGSASFIAELERLTSRPLRPGRRGRPPKVKPLPPKNEL